MRVWEIDTSKEPSAGLVLEQDFILRVRRMQRHPTPYLVLNFVLNAIQHLAKSTDARKAVEKKLQEFAKLTGGTYFEMSNGDAFIVWEETGDAHILSKRLIESILPEHSASAAQFLLTYHMPKDYTALRERTNHYIEVARAVDTVAQEGTGAYGARGPLTAKSVDQIGQVLNEIDLRPYGRSQTIYQHNAGAWQPLGEEYFISFEDLRRERFPKLELVSSEHFFLALCGMLDQRLLALLTNSFDTIGGRTINLNLSLASIVGSVFSQFVRRVPRDQRSLIGFELNRGDLLQDFTLTLSAIDMLKREGFRVALDSITPDMLTYVDLTAFKNVDSFKINVSKDRAAQLFDAKIRAALEKLHADKLIFFRCDNEQALQSGLELGVKTFQGWLIDDMAGKRNQAV